MNVILVRNIVYAWVDIGYFNSVDTGHDGLPRTETEGGNIFAMSKKSSFVFKISDFLTTLENEAVATHDLGF